MFKDTLLSVFEGINQTGHLGNAVDSMMDVVAGMGHRIKWGHDMQGMINALEIDGPTGLAEWFHHMMVDFTSADGIPLPFAEAITALTDMDMDTAIDWLCINIADAIEVGTEAAFLAAFKNNPRAYKLTLVLGTALGLIDDNPLLLAMNAVMVFRLLREKGIRIPLLEDKAAFVKRAASNFSKIAMGLAVLDLGAGLLGVDIAGLLDGEEYVDGAADMVDGIGLAGDIFDGIASLGMAFLLSRGIKWLFDLGLSDVRQRIAKKQFFKQVASSVKTHLRLGSLPPTWNNLLHVLDGTEHCPTQLGLLSKT